VTSKSGKGGRNLEMALAALQNVKKGQILVPFASDGLDNTEFAGGICDQVTKDRAKKLKIDIKKTLNNNDSFNFFKKTKCSIITGYTGSNVSDLIIAINVR
ncbi:MAG: MOFRL family protein, partial [bacterium]